MEIEFDPDKDTANVAKHGISPARAADFELVSRIEDNRYYEPRIRAYGRIDDVMYSMAFVTRDGKVRPISLRRAHEKEFRRHGS